MVLATKDTIGATGAPINSRLTYDEEDKVYYVEVHTTGLHQLLKVRDEQMLQYWLGVFKDCQ